MRAFEPVETARLVLRLPREDDAGALCDYYVRNESRIVPWEPARSHDPADHAAAIRAQRDPLGGSGTADVLACDAASGALVAVVTLSSFTMVEPKGASISYSVDGSYEGGGYASEAVTRVIACAFERLGIEVLSAYYHPANARSERLLARLGFSVVMRTPVVAGFEALMRPQVVARLRAG